MMIRKLLFTCLLMFALLFAVQIAFAQDPTLPEPGAIANELGNLLTILGIFAAFGTGAIAILKPTVFNRLSETLEPNAYLAVIYIFRFVFGAITLAFFGGVASLYTYAPSLEMLQLPEGPRDTVVFVGAAVLLSLGQETIYVVIDVLRSLAGKGSLGEPSAAAIERYEARNR